MPCLKHLRDYLNRTLFRTARTTGKMQHDFVIFRLLFPSTQTPTKAILPAMCSLGNPGSGPEVRGFTGLCSLFTRLDMQFVTPPLQIYFQLLRFVAFVQAVPDFLTRPPPFEEYRVYPQPVWCRAYMLLQRPATTITSQYRPAIPEAFENTCISPLLETPGRRTQWTYPGGFCVLHWHPVLMANNMTFITAWLSVRFRCVHSGWLILCSGIRSTIFSEITAYLPLIACHIFDFRNH